MRIYALELSAAELICLLRADANVALARPIYVAAQRAYIIEEDFDGSTYQLENDYEFDLVTSTTTLTVEPRVESGYWILEVRIECKLGPVNRSQAKKLTRKDLSLDECERDLYASGQKRVHTQLYVETPGVKADFDLWLAEIRERHPEVAGSLSDYEYQRQNTAAIPTRSIPQVNPGDNSRSVSPPLQAVEQHSQRADEQHSRSALQQTREREDKEERPHQSPGKIALEPAASPKHPVPPQLPPTPQMENTHFRRAKIKSEERRDHQPVESRNSKASIPSASRGLSASPRDDAEGQHNSATGTAITFIEQVLSKARDRLVTIRSDSPLTEAAERLYEPTCGMVVVCDVEGIMVGVITRTDIIRRIRHCQGAACVTPCGMVMSRQVIFCHPHDRLDDTWSVMKEIGLHSIPVIDARMKPIGLLSARDALETLLESVEYEEGLLRDYVMCVGYQ